VKVETDKREHDLPTVPSTIGLEKATNPFLRYREPAIAEQHLALRLWKKRLLSDFFVQRQRQELFKRFRGRHLFEDLRRARIGRGVAARRGACTLASSSGIIARTISAVTLRPSSSTPLANGSTATLASG
jgi:hypothetical protein